MFNASKIELGFSRFIPLDELCDSSRGFIVNDTCIIQVEILANKSEHENQVDKSVSKIDDDKHVECTDNRLPKEMISASSDKLVDFRGIGKVEQDFVPLLEEVCSRHPSLIDSKQKKSQRFIEWAFTALCRVLHFLKTKRVKDMDDDDACKHLQNLWEELEVFRFDLTWLEPHVQSALSMKNYMEKVALVKRLEENVTALEIETKRCDQRQQQMPLNLTPMAMIDTTQVWSDLFYHSPLNIWPRYKPNKGHVDQGRTNFAFEFEFWNGTRTRL
ncbi:hypothetical protein JHK84_027618 [Glycine max]|nr:hypothetical protein JHK84_027618 [Glycine max]